jgi:hypothetical protein
LAVADGVSDDVRDSSVGLWGLGLEGALVGVAGFMARTVVQIGGVSTVDILPFFNVDCGGRGERGEG